MGNKMGEGVPCGDPSGETEGVAKKEEESCREEGVRKEGRFKRGEECGEGGMFKEGQKESEKIRGRKKEGGERQLVGCEVKNTKEFRCMVQEEGKEEDQSG